MNNIAQAPVPKGKTPAEILAAIKKKGQTSGASSHTDKVPQPGAINVSPIGDGHKRGRGRPRKEALPQQEAVEIIKDEIIDDQTQIEGDQTRVDETEDVSSPVEKQQTRNPEPVNPEPVQSESIRENQSVEGSADAFMQNKLRELSEQINLVENHLEQAKQYLIQFDQGRHEIAEAVERLIDDFMVTQKRELQKELQGFSDKLKKM